MKEWIADWRVAPHVVTVDVFDGRKDARREVEGGTLVELDLEDRAATTAASIAEIVATTGSDVDALRRLAESLGASFQSVDRRRALAFGATLGFGGECIAIACEREVTLDCSDGERLHCGPTLPGLAQVGDVAKWAAEVDAAIYATAKAAGADGPLLVITGPDAPAYREHGSLPVQHVPELVHRGLRCRTWSQIDA